MADVDITSLSVEISAESGGAELNIDKLATAISNLRTKGNVTKVADSLDKLSSSISALKQASSSLDGLERLSDFFNGFGNLNMSGSVKSINAVVNAIKKIPEAISGVQGISSDLGDVKSVLNGFNSLPTVTAPEGLSSFVSLLRRIPKAVSEANSADYTQLAESSRQLMNGLAPLSVLDFSNLKNLGTVLNQLNKIPDLAQKLDAKTVEDFSTACQKLSAALTPLASQLDKVGNAFAKLPPQLSKVVTQANRVTATNQKASKSYMSLSSQMSGFMKRAAQLVSLKAIANYIGNAVVKFNDYYEAANLFGVSMKNLTSESSDFISKMETLLGIDPTEAMNNMATIQSLTTSFGMASDKAYVLSKNLTQLGYDLASLKNIPVAESFTKIQAAISGELEPIRRLGVDLSQARLQQELLALGFTQSVSSLSQADKAVLRYIAIMKQTTDAQGDFARTISSPANQIRVLQAQLASLARSVGSLLYPALSSILPPLIAAVELVKELVQWVAKLMGVKVEFPDFSSASAGAGGISDAMDDATSSTNKAAKALKSYTMGFDELNVIDPTQGSSSSGSGSGASGNILGDVDLSGYDMFKNYVGSSVDEIKTKFESLKGVIAAIGVSLAGLGMAKFIKDIGEAVSKMDVLQKAMASIATFTIEAVIVYKAESKYAETGNVADLILSWATTGIASYIGYKMWGPGGAVIGLTVSYVATLKAQADALSSGKESFGDASTWISILNQGLRGMAIALGVSVLTPFAVGAGAAALTGFSVGALIAFEVGLASVKDKLSQYPIMEEISRIVERVLVGGVVAGAALILGASVGVAAVAATAAVGILIGFNLLFGKPKKDENSEVDALSGADKEVDETLGKFETAVRKKISDVQKWLGEKWNELKSSLSGAWDALSQSISGGLEKARQKIDEKLQPFADAFKNICDVFSAENVQAKLTEIGTKISENFGAFVADIKQRKADALNAMGEWLEGLKEGVAQKIESVKSKVGEVVTAAKEKIESLDLLTSGRQWIENLISGVSEKIESARSKADEVITAVKNVFESLNLFDIGKNLIQGFINGVNNMLESAKNAVAGIGNSVIDKVKEVLGVHSPSTVFAEIGDFLMQGLVQGVQAGQQIVTDAMNTMGTNAINAAAKGLGLDTGTFNQMGQQAAIDTASGMNAQVPSVASLFGSAATYFGGTFWTNLDKEWKNVNSAIQTDTIGSIKTLISAIQKGDIGQIATWSASYFYAHLNNEQKQQIQSFATNALTQLGSSLSGVFQNLSGLASGFVKLFVPAAATATTAQTGLNVAMDANPIMLVISLIGMLVGALISFSGTNSDVANMLQDVWNGVGDFMSIIFEGILYVVGAGIQGFISLINGLIDAYNMVAKLWGGQISHVTNPAFDFANKIKTDREKRQADRKAQKEKKNNGVTSDSTDYDSEYDKLLKQMQDRINELNKQYENASTSTNGDSDDIAKAYKDQINALQKQMESMKNALNYAQNVVSKVPTAPNYSGNSSSSNSNSNYPNYNSPSYNPSDYAGTKEWTQNSGNYSGSYNSSTSVSVDFNEEEMRESVYNGTYNAFLDIFQRYGEELTGGKELKIYLDGRQLTASVEKNQNSRGRSLMGSEVYSY